MSIIYDGKLDYINSDNTIQSRDGLMNLMGPAQVGDLINITKLTKTNVSPKIQEFVKNDLRFLKNYSEFANVNNLDKIIPIQIPQPLKVYPQKDKNLVFLNITNTNELNSDDIYQLILYQKVYTKLHKINNFNESHQAGIQIFLGNLINSMFQKKFGYQDDPEQLKMVLIGFHAYVLKKFFNQNGLYSKVLKGFPDLEVDHNKVLDLCKEIERKEQSLSNLFIILTQFDVQRIDVNQVVMQILRFSNPETLAQFMSLDRFIQFMSAMSTQKYNLITKSIYRFIKSNNTISLITWVLNILKS